MEAGLVESLLPGLESSVQYISKAVPYIYTTAGAFAAKQLYNDYGKSRTMPKYLRNRSSARAARRYAPYRQAPTMAPSTMTHTRRTRFYHNLGTKPGSFATKRSTHEIPKNTNSSDKRIHSISLVRINWSDDDENLSTREHRIVNVRGVKFRKWFAFKPEKTNVDRPVTIRWCVINPKLNTGSNVTDINPGTNFFMSEDPSNEFSKDFPLTGTAFDYMNRGINRKRYGVLKQGFITLTPDPGQNSNYKDNKYHKLLQFYIPIKRQMKWASNNPGVTLPNSNLYFVWWYCDTGDMETAQQYPTNNDVPIQHMSEITTYFRTAAPFV